MIENMKPSNLCDVTLPAGWECARFRKLFSFGKGLSITKEDLVDEGVPVISYGQVHSKANTGTAIHESLIRFVPESYLKTDKQALTQEGNFIFADTSEDLSGVGNCAFVNTTETLFAGYHSIIARPKGTNMYPKYFAYLFLTDIWRDQIRAKVMGVKVFSISQKLLRDTTVFIPPILEQKAIANLLDTKCAKIDSVIADIEEQIETLQKYKKSLITETVTKGLDQSVPMKDSGIDWIGKIPSHWRVIRITKYLDSLVDYRGKTPEKVDDGVFLVTARNIKNGIVDYSLSQEYVAAEEYEQIMHRGKPEIGDVLFTTEAPLGEVANVDRTDIALAQRVIKFRGRKGCVDNYYLKYWLMSLGFQSFLWSLATGSTALGIAASKLGQLKMVLPPIDEQKAIAERLDCDCTNIDAIIVEKWKQLETAQQYKKSLIYEYVTGKKRVTEVN